MIDVVLFFAPSTMITIMTLVIAIYYFDVNGGDNKLNSFFIVSTIFIYWLVFTLSFGEFQEEHKDYVAYLSPSGIPYIEKNGVTGIGEKFNQNISEGTIIRTVRSKRLHAYVDFPFSGWTYEILEGVERAD